MNTRLRQLIIGFMALLLLCAPCMAVCPYANSAKAEETTNSGSSCPYAVPSCSGNSCSSCAGNPDTTQTIYGAFNCESGNCTTKTCENGSCETGTYASTTVADSKGAVICKDGNCEGKICDGGSCENISLKTPDNTLESWFDSLFGKTEKPSTEVLTPVSTYKTTVPTVKESTVYPVTATATPAVKTSKTNFYGGLAESAEDTPIAVEDSTPVATETPACASSNKCVSGICASGQNCTSCKTCDSVVTPISVCKTVNKNTTPSEGVGQNAKVINVAGDGSGDFNCDGKGDHIQINQALTFAAKNPGTIVHLKGPFTYDIGDSLLISSNTILEGESGVTIKLAKGLPVWGGRGSSISAEKAMLMIKGSSATNVTIKNLIVDGSQSDYYPQITLGWSSFNMATLIGCNRLTIQDVTFKNGCNDAILLNKCSNILVDGITVNKCGHDGIYAYNVNSIKVTNSKFINRTNSSCRFYTVTNGVFANNDCTTAGGGYAGLELEGTVKNIEVYGNNFHGLAGPAIAHVNTKEINVNIHDNTIN